MATSTLGRLTLDLAVKIGSYVEGMSKAERKTKDSTKKMGDSLSAFKAQVSDAFGGTQLGSIIDNFNGKLGSLKGNIGVTGAAIAGMAAGGALLGAAALSKMAIETAKADMQLQMLANRANTSVQNFQILEHAALGFGVMGLFIDTTNSAVGLNSGVSIVSIGMNAFAGVVVTAAGVLRTLFSIARESMVQLINVGSTLYNVVTAGSIGGAIDALKTGANVAKQSLFAVGTTALDSGKKAVAAFSGTTSAQNKLTQAILKSSESTRQNNTGLKVNTKQADDNAEAKSKLAKAESNYNKVLQERGGC